MFTLTKDLILPTSIAGSSWPRPSWFTEQLSGSSLSKRMQDIRFREQYTDALATMATDLERAGLDIVVTGDYHHDASLGGYHWISYLNERLAGTEGWEQVEGEMPPHGAGSILGEVFSAWRAPRILDKIQRSPARPLEFAKIWRLAQARSNKPVMFGTVSAQEAAWMMNTAGGPYENDQRQLIWDTATAVNQELRELAAAGCKAIMIEEPSVHLHALEPDSEEQVDFLVEAFNHEVSGLEGVEIWVQTCWGGSLMQRGITEWSYKNSIETFIERLNFDVWTVEAKDDDGLVIDMLKPYGDRLVAQQKKIGLGVVSHRTVQVETPEDVASLTRRALEAIPVENLALCSDSGFGRQGQSRPVALYKAAAIAQGANIVRRELGYDEQEIRIADPSLQADVWR